MHGQPVALITGASRGIGAATARELGRRGYALALAARSADALTRLAGELSQSGCPALPIPTDLRRPDQVQRLAQLTHAHFGHVDALINNAGIGDDAVVAKMTDASVDAQLATNLLAPITLTRMLLPDMLARRRGAIIFVASVVGHIGLPTAALYGSTKFGLRGFAIGLRREVAAQGVGVAIVSPGFIDTAMTKARRFVPKAPPERVARVIADLIERPRREVFVPGYYRLFVWLDRLAPWLIDRALRPRATFREGG
jgi:short-subunit dehydrogenase